LWPGKYRRKVELAIIKSGREFVEKALRRCRGRRRSFLSHPRRRFGVAGSPDTYAKEAQTKPVERTSTAPRCNPTAYLQGACRTRGFAIKAVTKSRES